MPTSAVVLLTVLMCHYVECLKNCIDPKYATDVNNPYLGAYVHLRKIGAAPLGLADNQCMAKVVQGNWCAWEPIMTGHGVSSCQKGLNIRWRRRICACPQPRPIHDSRAWCRSEKNVSAIAKLKNSTLLRLQALKPNVWRDQAQWDLWPGINSMARLTNSLLGCIELDECYFHTGTTYRGTASRAQRPEEPCDHWKNYMSDLERYFNSKNKLEAFLGTNPKNYCRNPVGDKGARLKPWCFTGREASDSTIAIWRFCNVNHCGSHQHFGTVVIRKTLDNVMQSRSGIPSSPPREIEINAESCFESCRLFCHKYAAINYREIPGRYTIACQCIKEDQLWNKKPSFDHLQSVKTLNSAVQAEYNKLFNLDPTNGAFKDLTWNDCYLFSSKFKCPSVKNENTHGRIFASLFEVALPSKCYEINHLAASYKSDEFDTMTLYRSMGNLRSGQTIQGSSNWVLLSSRELKSKELKTVCSHDNKNPSPACPKFDASSIDEPKSHFNLVVDQGYHWIIIDTGKHDHIALVQLNGKDLLDLEILVRSVPLPNWLRERKLKTQGGVIGHRAVYYGKASESEKMLWSKCEPVKKITSAKDNYISECSSHQKTRWIMIRRIVDTDMLENKYVLGYHWVDADNPHKCCLEIGIVSLYTLPPHPFNCITMHHPPIGPEYADYWEDQFSFASDGQPQDPPVMTPANPQFKLPLVTHDSVNPDEQFIQEDWDVEPCGDWELMERTTIIGVPAKLKITFKSSHDRGESCSFRPESIRPNEKGKCFRDVYFRVDHDGREVVHYPDFGRSYDLTANLKNCQFVCAISRECKAFEFSPMNFCQLHLISYKQESMLAYAQNSTYGRKTDTMRTSNAFTWNNPQHPYYRLLQDLRTESEFHG